MWPLLRDGLGGGDNTTLLLYFPAFLADASLAGVALARLATVVADCAALGGPAKVILFVGRPDFYGPRGLGQHDPVNNATARAYLTTALAAMLAIPSLRPPAVVHGRDPRARRGGRAGLPASTLLVRSHRHACLHAPNQTHINFNTHENTHEDTNTHTHTPMHTSV
jgi:hypothetical protein